MSAERRSFAHELVHGVVAGQIAGLLMTGFVMLVSVVHLHRNPIFPGQIIGSVFFREHGLVGAHLGAAIAGFLFHQLGPSLVWGTLFGAGVWLFDARRGGRLPVIALNVGLLSQLIGVYVVLPVMFRGVNGHDTWNEQFPVFWSWAANLVFALGLLVWPLLQERRRPALTTGR